MRFRMCRIVAGIFLVVVSPWASREASAGLTTYEWGPMVGSGYDVTYPWNQTIPFATNDGSLLIGYDPDDPWNSFIDVSVGGPGFQVMAFADFRVTSTFGGLTLSAEGAYGESVTVIFWGNAGPIAPQGLPGSLGPFAACTADVEVRGAYDMPDQFVFSGEAYPVPEPPPLPGLILGIVGASLVGMVRACARRRGGGPHRSGIPA